MILLTCCAVPYLLLDRYVVALLPVVAFGTITEGSLTAELGVRYTGEDDQVLVVVMNLLVRAAPILCKTNRLLSLARESTRRLSSDVYRVRISGLCWVGRLLLQSQ